MKTQLTRLLTTTLFLGLLFTGCSQKESQLQTLPNISKAKVKKVELKDIKGFYEDDLALAFEVFKKDCKRSKRFKLFENICEKTESFSNPSQFFSENFTAYELHNNNGTNDGLITGYYEPLLFGSRTKNEKYKYWLGQINYDNKAGGELLLNTLVAAQLKKRPNDKIYVTAISGDFDKVSKDREYIFSQNKKINLLGNITINQIIPMYWDPNNVTERFSMLEKRYPNTNIYWCAGDQLALKVLALKGDKDLVIGGFDWLPVALQKIKKGELDASVGGHFLMATIGLIKIVDYENGFNTFLNPPLLNKFEVITRANIDSHLAFFEKKLWQKINFNSYLASQNKQPPLLSITNLIEKYNQEKAVK